ncbi:SdrD B-like domain protein [uncultured archaeon]|nr:SdrD B-like domain protein [uncultured archaeon]
MRKVLAITVALMIAAIIFSPALGYTNQSAGNQSYTAESGAKVNYSFSSGVPAHNVTSDMLVNKYTLKSSGVQSTKVPYSFKEGGRVSYSAKVIGVDNAVAEGEKIQKEAALLGSVAKNAKAAEAAAAPVTTTEAASTTPAATTEATNATTEAAPAPKFTIEGIVFNDSDASGAMDNNETGLADWTVNLEQPAGTILKTATTGADGKFSFADLAAGEYTVSEVLQMGWKLISPAEGKTAVTISNENIANLVFANQIAPVVADENMTAPANATEAPANATEVAPVAAPENTTA